MLSIASIVASVANRGRLVPTGQLGQPGRLQTSYRNSGVLLEMVKSVVPTLTFGAHKGDCGRIGIVGGCQEYTGAPYFAAISALKLGADLSHVFCAREAASVIKSYSPELIVHPLLYLNLAQETPRQLKTSIRRSLEHLQSYEQNSVTFEKSDIKWDSKDCPAEVSQWLPRMHSLVVGPGLGRADLILDNARNIIEQAKERRMPLVIDADGLYLITEDPYIISGYERAILTPNVVEFNRLYEKVVGEAPMQSEPVVNVKTLCEKLGNVTIVQKGENDIISDGKKVLVCCNEGSPRRCGGQGDLLSGTMGTFSFWTHKVCNSTAQVNNESLRVYGPTISAAYAACLLTRECNRRAYSKNRRSMTTSDMIECIRDAFENLYE